MSDGFLFLLVVAVAVGLLYVWLRGWWFVGVLLALPSVGVSFQFWGWVTVPAAMVFGFATWVGWQSVTPAGRRFWAEAYADPKQSRPKLQNMRPQIRSGPSCSGPT